ncbi:MAG: sensor domain-containing diguanylate cyclase [Hyphomicrobiales bacterium]|nr:sensor domain-containing diguanylate cyclase [Hyphomicrobiales bacterium]
MIECKVGNEKDRLDALYSMELLDTPAEEAFDRITRLAKSVLETPIVVVSLVDESRQWFKSKLGLEADETPRDIAFCDHTIRQSHPLIVENALLDERFADNPLVTGEPGIRFYAGAPLRTRDGHNIGTLCVIDFKPRTISEQQLAILGDLARLVVDEMELRLIATKDSLTGTMTRRALFDAAGRDLARARRKGFDLSCAVLDIDHFKSINDTLGHAGADLVLQQVMDVCRRSLRGSDYIGRIGGEEFAIILQDISYSDVFDVLERMRSKIEKLAVDFAGKAVPVTASFGVAALTPSTGSFDELLHEADTALYVAKADGRNRIVGSEDVEQAVNAA